MGKRYEVRYLQHVGQEEATEEGVRVHVEAVEPLHVLLDAVRVVVPHVLVRHMAEVPVRAIMSRLQYSHEGVVASYTHLHVDATANPINNQSTSRQYMTDHR